MKPYYQDGAVTLYLGDCRAVLPLLSGFDAVVTDPPYLTGDARVPIVGRGVAPRRQDSESVGLPWGYDLEWIDLCGQVTHWVVFAHFAMLGSLCTRLPPKTVFCWRKPNAPNMTRPVPRMDSEFIVWSAAPGASMGRMKEFRSMVLDVPMAQAGCMASERFVDRTGKAVHPCQKPLDVVRPFVVRLAAETILDPYAGTGTTLVAAKNAGRHAIGVEIEERYCELAANRLRQEVLPLCV